MGPVRSLTDNSEDVAGNGEECTPGEENLCGDGGLAIQARLRYPKGLYCSTVSMTGFLSCFVSMTVRRLRPIVIASPFLVYITLSEFLSPSFSIVSFSLTFDLFLLILSFLSFFSSFSPHPLFIISSLTPFLCLTFPLILSLISYFLFKPAKCIAIQMSLFSYKNIWLWS